MRPRDLTVLDLLAQLTKSLSKVDRRLIRSFRALVTKPGSLTASYISGQRRKYLAPLSLFLIANALFFATQSLTKTNIFSSTLESHLRVQDWSPLAQELVGRHLASSQISYAVFADRFNAAALLYAKSLIIVMALVFSAILPLAFYGTHRRLGVHIVFAIHLYSFVLLLFCGSLLIAEAHLLSAGAGLDSPPVDTALTIINLLVCFIYLHIAIGVVYGATGLPRLVKAALLAVAVPAIVVGYRFLIFLVALYGA
ncbi:MAG: DUF3667 domain-containing protein [Sphingomicrobium sp.]